MKEPIADLARLTDALYRAELSKFQTINAREASLRKDLRDLDDHLYRGRTLPENQMKGLRQIGADVLWQGWVSRTRRDLNTELAQLLLQKERLKVGLRHAFGKKQAAQDLLDQNIQSKINDRAKRQLQTAEAQQLNALFDR